MWRLTLVFVASILIFTSGCSSIFRNPFGGGDDDDDRPSAEPNRIVEPTAKFALAVGGVAPGRDELVIYDAMGNIRDFSGKNLECTAEESIVLIRNRPGFDSPAAGSGVQIVAIDSGVTGVRCKEDGSDIDGVYEVTVPPQNLIQVLVAEASEQLSDEATIDTDKGDDVVALDSSSKTGNAIGAVIRNRIGRINAEDDPGLFEADAKYYDFDAPGSYYDAVITASGQFAPVHPKDPNHTTFEMAQDRNFLDEEWRIAYDQAVITAAGIFNGDILDTTGGAFAFISPTEEEWLVISESWIMHAPTVPFEAGFSDASFPSLAPVQLLIHPDVWKYKDGRPSFVFARSRTEADYAIVNTP